MWPPAGPGTVVAMEMLERDEQVVVDDYRDGVISSDEFTKLTFSRILVRQRKLEHLVPPDHRTLPMNTAQS